ncbi:MAG: RHS repeat-associated core domain-containing protein [Rhodanobacteraceae bacterium]|nr:RHS repeat-associated core domain-containing protein [Rhodanobacteraceae bacterium]
MITEWMLRGHYGAGVNPETSAISQVDAMLVQDEHAQVESYVPGNGLPVGTFRSTSTTGKYLRYKAGATPAQQTWELTHSDGSAETYDRAGRLIAIIYPNDPVRSLQLNYGGPPITGPYGTDTSSNDPMFFRLTKISDGSGRFVTLEYENPPFFRLRRVVSDAGVELMNLGYDSGQRMRSITRFGKTRSLLYNETAHAPLAASVNGYWLTGIVDEDGRRFATYIYDSWGRASGSWHGAAADSAGRVAVEYLDDYTSRVTQPSGRQTTYTYYTNKPYRRVHTITDAAGQVTLDYSAANRLSAQVDRRGHRTEYEFTPDGPFEKVRTEAKGTPDQRRIETDWDIALGIRTDERVFDDPPAGPRVKKSETHYRYVPGTTRLAGVDRIDPVSAETRSMNLVYCSAADVVNGASTYCAFEGQVRSVDGPRADVADVTTYAYRRNDDFSGCGTFAGPCHHKGDLWRTTNALGHVDEVVTYDRAGRVVRTRDANGTYTDYTYHARGWLLERSIRADATGVANAALDAVSRYVYDDSGNVTYVYPAGGHGAYLKYGYDDAHRIKSVTDSLGNRVEYALDREGNRTSEKIYGSDSALKYSLSREYNALNRLIRVANASNSTLALFAQNAPGISEGYDANGNPRRVSDGLGVITEQQFDALDRLAATVRDYDPAASSPTTANATTTFKYDALDRPTHVVDPDGVPTDYVYNGFGDVTRLISQDAGARDFRFDAGGNRTRETDARGHVTNYTFDALNRPVSTLYSDSSFNVQRDYDQPDSATGCIASYSLGRLTQISDRDGITTFCYDRRGNVVRKTVESLWNTRSIAYEYTRGDLLKSVTYPSGAIVRYGRDAMARIASVTWQANASATPTLLVSSVSYYPYGAMQTLTFGSGRALTKTYDQNYAIDKIASSAAGGLVLDYTLDVSGAVADVAPTLGGTPERRYVYDRLGRLTSLNDGAKNPLVQWEYSPGGDRMLQRSGRVVEPYVYSNGSHRLASIGWLARATDPNGNTTVGIAAQPLQYDPTNRLSRVIQAPGGVATATDYTYDGQGQRVRKLSPVSRTDTWYDEEGRRLADQQYVRWCQGGSSNATGGNGVTGAPVEVCGNGGTIQNSPADYVEYIYLDALPIALARSPQGLAGPVLSYLETDHLGTPRVAVDPSTNAVQWQWSFFGSAFGEHTPTAVAGGIQLDMRFPGQFYDAESGLHYNYFRDYEPSTGRYIESDPLGLGAGTDTYSYVESDPLGSTDEFGLFKGPAVSPPLVQPPGTTYRPGTPGPSIGVPNNGLNPTNALPWYAEPAPPPPDFFEPRINPWDRAGYKNKDGDILACSIDNGDKCRDLIREMWMTVFQRNKHRSGTKGLQQRLLEQLRDRSFSYRVNKESWDEHDRLIRDGITRLRNKVNDAVKLGCAIPSWVHAWLYLQPPTKPWYMTW